MNADNDIFVFGSNYAGRHGRGAALTAQRKFGAVLGVGDGLQGRSYGISTKDAKLRVLSLNEIELNIRDFIKFAEENPQYRFYVTEIGTGLAGYSAAQVAPLFSGSPVHCIFSKKWEKYLGNSYEYFSQYL